MQRSLFILAATFGIVYSARGAESRKPPAEIAPGVVGDGVHDDTPGLQALLDSGRTEVHFPSPPACLLISKTLTIHSRQTLVLRRHTVIRLKEHSDQVMITNEFGFKYIDGFIVRRIPNRTWLTALALALALGGA